ncbi:hypothetical protein [Ruminococcus flavefaciens]|uniref:hypothetical protein n=1 Tax=Ruminococcus flavefaciens TaxID=1265 RepID=UPI000491641D|nr:hypothetical protein [Ruminococcus flavefaciens]
MTFEEIIEEAKSAETLEILFSLWKQAHAAEQNYEKTTVPTIEKNSFITDGYVSEADYIKTPIKVLFVLREANIATHREADDAELRTHQNFYGDFLKDINIDNPPKQKQKMARMAYYLQHPELSEEERKKPDETSMKKALASCAYMNINKRGGDKKVNWHIFNKYYTTYEEFIKKEISILNPDITVLIGKNNYSAFDNAIKVWHTAYPMPKKDKTGHEICDNGNINCYMREFFLRVKKYEK